jgi:hypothetical protein
MIKKSFRSLLVLGFATFFILGAKAQSNMVLLVSPPGEFIGQGKTYYTTNLADFTADFNTNIRPNKVPLAVETSAFGFFLDFAGPNGAAPSVGIYSNAVKYPEHGSSPGLNISANGRYCYSVCGNFQVFEIEKDSSGHLTRFWATFSQRCECGGGPALTGEIRFHSALAPQPPVPRILRVPADYSTIQAALDNANLNVLSVDQILVDPGLYQESLQFGAKRVQLIGVGGPSATFIMATGGVAIAIAGTTPEALISGFTLMDSVTGISISAGGSPTIVSNSIVNCGTGIVCDSGSIDRRGSPVIRGNEITGCAGAAIQLSFTGTPIVEANDLEDNGGGIGMSEAGHVTVFNNLIRRNRGDGSLLYNNSPADFIQNLIVENGGSGISWVAPPGTRGPWLINNTIAGNAGPGIAGTFSDGVEIINNIVVGNPAISVGNAPLIIHCNDFFSRTGWAFVGITNVTGVNGNVSADPFFICEPGGNYRLLATSPCLDKGRGSLLMPQFDFDGQRRVIPAATNAPPGVDMGAFEFNPANPATDPCLFLYCPSKVVVTTPSGLNSAIVNFPAPFASPGATVTNFPASGSVFLEGTNTVTSTATYGTNVLQCSFTVTVLVPPSISSQPQGVVVSAGESTNLNVIAQGSSPLHYQWMFENAPIAGATNSTLQLTNIQANTYYQVLITNAAGSVTSAEAMVRVLPAAPSIISGPNSLTVPAGSNAVFQIVAHGTSPLWFQWFHDGTPLVPSTTPQLVITNAQVMDMGTYYVVLSNSLGLATSSPASLVITSSAPKFIIQPSAPPGGLLFTGTNFTLAALARGSNPIFYQWRKGSTNLPGMTDMSLVLSNVTQPASGGYSVVATNMFGSVTSTVVFIRVFGSPPAFTQQPASVEVLAGSTTTLNSLANGSTPLSYQWTFYGTNLPGQTNRQLTLSSVALENAGPYFVTASNAFGTSNSIVAQLTVNQSLVITQPLTNQVVDQGATVSLALGATSTGAINYSWQFNGIILSSTNGTLVLTNVQPAQSGFYRVVVGNEFGSLASTGRISVFGPPSAVVAWGDNSNGQTAIPTNLNDVIAVTGGDYHTLGLRHNGTLLAWGYNRSGQTTVPINAKNFVAVAAGAEHNLAITDAGDVVAWGRNDSGQCTVPSDAIPALSAAAGASHSLVLHSSGTVLAWGDNSFGQSSVPAGLNNVRAIAAGRDHSLALLNNGTVVGWGLNTFGQATPPAGLNDIAAIAAGYLHSIALRSNGVVVAWGDNTYNQTNVPLQLTNVVAIAAGDFHSLALSADGTVTSWGNDWLGQTNVPSAATGAWAIGSGYYHSLALIPRPTLHIGLISNDLVVQWNGPGILQWSFSPAGPYEDIPGLAQSYTNSDFSMPMKFFRLRR